MVVTEASQSFATYSAGSAPVLVREMVKPRASIARIDPITIVRS